MASKRELPGRRRTLRLLMVTASLAVVSCGPNPDIDTDNIILNVPPVATPAPAPTPPPAPVPTPPPSPPPPTTTAVVVGGGGDGGGVGTGAGGGVGAGAGVATGGTLRMILSVSMSGLGPQDTTASEAVTISSRKVRLRPGNSRLLAMPTSIRRNDEELTAVVQLSQ